jgi:hypothetical protein
MASSGMLRFVVFVRTDVSEELSASIIRVTLIMLALSRFLQEPHGVTSNKTPFFVELCSKVHQKYKIFPSRNDVSSSTMQLFHHANSSKPIKPVLNNNKNLNHYLACRTLNGYL